MTDANDKKAVVRRALKSLFEDYRGADSEFASLFSPDYQQWANGEAMSYSELLAHFAKLQTTAPNRRIDFVDMACEGDIVFDHHLVTIIHSPDDREHVDVFAKWTVRKGRITHCEELTMCRNMSGPAA